MFTTKYLDASGLATLWERIQRLVYECGCQCAVRYHLEVDGNTVILVGSDGSRSSVDVSAATACDESE